MHIFKICYGSFIEYVDADTQDEAIEIFREYVDISGEFPLVVIKME